MKLKELPDIVRFPLGIIAGLLAGVMFTAVSFTCLKVGEYVVSFFK